MPIGAEAILKISKHDKMLIQVVRTQTANAATVLSIANSTLCISVK